MTLAPNTEFCKLFHTKLCISIKPQKPLDTKQPQYFTHRLVLCHKYVGKTDKSVCIFFFATISHKEWVSQRRGYATLKNFEVLSLLVHVT